MENKIGFSGSQLKWLAIITMFFDHTAKILSFKTPITITAPGSESLPMFYTTFQALFPFFITIGRLSFPIFCFLLVEGFLHTSNRKKYASRLFFFALLSEIPYDLAFRYAFFAPSQQNVFFTLFIGLLVVMALDKYSSPDLRGIIISIFIVMIGMFTAEFFHTDYGGTIGIFLITTFYLLRKNPLLACLIGGLIILQNSFFGIFAFIPIYFYNGQRGKQWKYFFYLFYPGHLLFLVAIRQFLLIPYLLAG